MDFETYKEWRTDILTRHTPERFDCLNPFLAMDFTRRWHTSPTPAEPAQALEAWKHLHRAAYTPARWGATQGVRSALGGIFAAAQERGMELWLPQDVYPFYAQEAARSAPQCPIRRFPTLPQPDFGELDTAQPAALLVITHPLSPLGRFLAPHELSALRAWSQCGRDRWVVLDSVYLYANRLPAGYAPGFGADRILGLFSLSKSWLLRGVFGAIGGPAGGDDWWLRAPAPPSNAASGDALAALHSDPMMPARQRQVFRAEWARRGHHLHHYRAPAAGPGSGYFRPVRVQVHTALERDNILLVPASVFGHTDPEWSIATCLYEAAAVNSPPP